MLAEGDKMGLRHSLYGHVWVLYSDIVADFKNG